MSLSECCLRGFTWDGTPSGRTGKLSANDAYITGTNPSAAVLVIHDGLGWTYSNVRLLADHYAREADVTVYVPDFFGGEVLDAELLKAGRWAELDMESFMARNSRANREPEVFACARALRDQGFARVAAVGFCYGGWGCFRLAAQTRQGGDLPLVDCISVAHPAMLTEEDIAGARVPVQVLAPEIDMMYTPELKEFTFRKLQELGVVLDYQHFPGMEHGCLTRGDESKEGERAAMIRAKNAAVSWMRQWLH